MSVDATENLGPRRGSTSAVLPIYNNNMTDHFSSIESLLSSVRGKKMSDAVYADAILKLSVIKSCVIDSLLKLNANSTSNSAIPNIIPPVPPVSAETNCTNNNSNDCSNPLSNKSYASIVSKVTAHMDSVKPLASISSAVRTEMKRTTIESLNTSNAERVCKLELEDQARRSKNAMIYGVLSSDDALATFDEISTTCAISSFSSTPYVQRVGPIRSDNTQAIKIQFSTADDCNKLFANKSALTSNDRLKKVFIRHDLTPLQSDIRRDLVQQAKEASKASSDAGTSGFRVIGDPGNWSIVPVRSRHNI